MENILDIVRSKIHKFSGLFSRFEKNSLQQVIVNVKNDLEESELVEIVSSNEFESIASDTEIKFFSVPETHELYTHGISMFGIAKNIDKSTPQIIFIINTSQDLLTNQDLKEFELEKSSDGLLVSRQEDVGFVFSDQKTLDNNSKEESLEALKQKLNDEISKRLTLMSDFQNYQKRMEQQKATFGAIANLGLIEDILEVFDDIALALNDTSLTLELSKESLNSAQAKLIRAIEGSGVERVDVKIGDEFDSKIMEAISTIPDAGNKNKVVAVINSAFKFKDRDSVIKPAKVVVGK